MIPGIIVTIPGTLPGMVPVGDSVGAGVASTPVGAVLGTVRRGAITARVTGGGITADIMEVIGDTITIIMPVRIIIDHQDVRRPAVILQEETLPVDIAVVRVAGGIHQIVAVQPVHRH